MSDEFEILRRLRPDRVQPDDPADPFFFARQKEDLMSVIDQPSLEATTRRDPAMYPRLAYLDEVAALEHLTRVFGFRERREARMGSGGPDDPMLAWLDFGDGVVMIGRSTDDARRVHQIYSPAEVGRATAMIMVRVDDIDAHYTRAVAEGANVTLSLQDTFYGSRRYEADDTEGHRWHFHESLASVRARGGTVSEPT